MTMEDKDMQVRETAAQAEDKPGEIAGKKAEEKKQGGWKKELREWIVSLATALLIVLVVRTFLFTLIRVEGDSMYDTLRNGERLFVTVADVKLSGVDRGDVVICHYPNRGRSLFVKRVKGLPGDQVERVGGITYVTYTDENGETVRESLDRFGNSTEDYEPYTLGEDEYFVVGDNRTVSHDSRDWNDHDPSRDVGPITRKMIVGKARYVIWPPNDFRAVE